MPRRARTQAKLLLLAVLGFMAIVSLWTPLAFERIAERWFSLPNFLFLWWVPAATALAAFAALARCSIASTMHCRSCRRSRCFCWVSRPCDLELSLSRSTIPDDLADGRCARDPNLHADGHAMMLPIIIGYMIFVYWTFGGKLREGEGYHSQDAAVR